MKNNSNQDKFTATKEFILILKDLLSQMRSFREQIESINETLDKTLKLFKPIEEPSLTLETTLSK